MNWTQPWTGAPTRRPALLTLGTGTIVMGPKRSAAGYLLFGRDGETLVDGGPGTLLRLNQAQIAPASIGRVVLSHFHPDHHADLLGLLFLRRNPDLGDERAPLTVLGPPGLAQLLEDWYAIYGSWIRDPELAVVELELGRNELADLVIHAYPAKHSKNAFCYRFEFPGGETISYSGDSDYCESLVEASRNVDFCLVECSHPDDLHVSGHMSPGLVVQLLAEARPRLAGLTHFYPAMEAELADRARWEQRFAELDCEVVALEDLTECLP